MSDVWTPIHSCRVEAWPPAARDQFSLYVGEWLQEVDVNNFVDRSGVRVTMVSRSDTPTICRIDDRMRIDLEVIDESIVEITGFVRSQADERELIALLDGFSPWYKNKAR